MDFIHKVDLSDTTIAKLQEGLNFLNIPKGKVPELMDSTIQLMKTATLMLKIAMILMPISVIGIIVSLFL
jgi:hypothetical protein